VEIREIRPDEVGATASVTIDGYREAYGETLGSYADTLADVERRIREAVVLVAVEDGAIVGTVTYVGAASSALAEHVRDGEAAIRMLAVTPDAKRRGIGRALSLACIERARTDGKHAVMLHADEVMTASQSLYVSLGFIRDPSRDFAPDDGTQLLCYLLPLL